MATKDNTYPANVSVEYPESSSRLLAFLGFFFWLKMFALIPHIIVLTVLSLVAGFLATIGYLVVLFTGTYPRGLFDFQVGMSRWNFRINCWLIGLTDKYPPFSFQEGDYPADVSIEYPESSSRLLAFLGLFFLKMFVLIPHIIVLYILSIVSFIILNIGYLVVIFTGTYPRGLFDFMLGVGTWNYRVTAWYVGLVDKYPPFSLK